MKIKKREYAELTRIVIIIGANRNPLELEIEKKDNAELILMVMVITIGAHQSSLELEIEKRDNAELTLMVITIGSPWTPL